MQFILNYSGKVKTSVGGRKPLQCLVKTLVKKLNNIIKKSCANCKAKMSIWKSHSVSTSVALANYVLYSLVNFGKSELLIIFFPLKGCQIHIL